MTFKEAMAAATLAYLEDVLALADGKTVKAAKLSGIHRATMHKLLVRHGLPLPRRGVNRIRTVRLLDRPKKAGVAPQTAHIFQDASTHK